jgi:LacI family transcriptional regulator
MEHAMTRGQTVPGDVSIIGFDDIPIASHRRIGLTTVHFDAEDTGEVAIEMLLQAIAESRHVSTRVTLPASLVVRSSTGPANRNGSR